jgi:uncharacterized protein
VRPSTTTSETFTQFLIKIHSRCNLACDYCYVYEHADQSWRDRPRVMPAEVMELAARRIGEHTRRHALPTAAVILHGGEPLLAGPTAISRAARAVRAATGPQTRVDLHVQTNGVLLDERFLAVFDEHDIRVGVSLDGSAVHNDRHRRFPGGGGSHRRAVAGVRLLAERRPRLYGGILCTIQLENDPLEVYRELLALAPPRLDFLLPHGNWTTPPPGLAAPEAATPYADWLIPIFDEWFVSAPRTGVRLFESILDLLLGGESGTEGLGLRPVDLVVIETDGAIELGDALKTTVAGMAATGLHLRTHDLDEAAAQPAFGARRAGLAALSVTCRRCPLVRVCGGGLHAHRYAAENGFGNPSVYCADLARLIRHVDGRLRDALDVLRAGANAERSELR